MARRVAPNQPYSTSRAHVSAYQLSMTGESEECGGRGGGGIGGIGGIGSAGRGYMALAKNSITSPRPQTNSLTECFKIGCGDKGGRLDGLPKKPEPPPSELFFKNGVRALWADKHCPRSLSGFQCHAQQTQQMKQLISQGNCPHLLLEGPTGSGKKALATALLHEIFGDVKILHEHKPFAVPGAPHPTITVPIASSRYHVEVNLLHVGAFDKDVLPTIFKEINLSSERAMNSPAITHSETDTFKLIVVLHGEKMSGEAQQTLRRLMDRYRDTCKLVLCCNRKEGPVTEPVLSEAIRARCQTISVEVPEQEEIVRVLTQVAKKEDVILPKAFAAKIADHCKDLRKAIVQLEACKNYQYPFSSDQRLHISHWEEDVIGIVTDIIADPTPKRLFLVRPSMQALLTDCVSPVLILQKLLEELLLRTDSQQLKKQICHWAGFYEARLRTVPQPICQLDAYLAKITSIYKIQTTPKARRSFGKSPSVDHSLEFEMSPSQHSSSSPFIG
ncbi:unnamed protein product [Calypogeia fissa]